MFRVSFFFQQGADLNTGWSANFWNTSTDFTALVPIAGALRDALNAFTGTGTLPVATRIADLSGFRQAQLIRHNYTLPDSPSKPEYSDFPDTAVLVKLLGDNKVVVHQWIRGLREAQLDNQFGKLSFRTVDVNRFNTIRSLLLNSSYGWTLRVRDPLQPLKDIKNISSNGIVTVTGHGYEDLSIVRISRCKGMLYANNKWKITDITADTFQLIGWQTALVDGPYLGNGKVRLLKIINTPIKDVVAARASRHESGRPFGLRGGRRKRRKT